MESLKYLYRIGRGPSSSHTMAPYSAARDFAANYSDANNFSAVLYGSMAKTGKGHLTDIAITDAFAPHPVKIDFNYDTTDLSHANTFDLSAYKEDQLLDTWRVISVGGGKFIVDGKADKDAEIVYRYKFFSDIKEHCTQENIKLWQYVEKEEGKSIWDYLQTVWEQMTDTISDGLEVEGTLPGRLHLPRKAKHLFTHGSPNETDNTRYNRLVCAYAYAVSEQSAAGGIVVTAPTCGSAGVVPAVLHYCQLRDGFSDKQILQALATGGLIGNLIKTNASISGAECGCQAEVGSACCMAAAALAELYEMDIDQIEYAAEVSMEHHLGLTCDPIDGLVQIPCIERNAVAAMRALDSLSLARFLTHTRKISFDMVVATMYETGRDLFSKYKETAEGGLAKFYHKIEP